MSKVIVVGKISGAHGIRGNAIITSFTENKEDILNLPTFVDNNQVITIKLISFNSKNKLICKINDISSRNIIETLVGKEILSFKENLPVITNDNEFYLDDIKGLKVLDINLNEIGIVINALNFGAGDILEIKFLDNNKKVLYPFDKDHFPEIHNDYIILNQ